MKYYTVKILYFYLNVKFYFTIKANQLDPKNKNEHIALIPVPSPKKEKGA
jgi:hypothetical protein